MDEADPETRDFINQYLDYSKLLGFALVQATEEVSSTMGRMLDYFSTSSGNMAD